MTRPLGAAAGGARAGRSPCAARRTPLSTLPAPELPHAATSPECSQFSHLGSDTVASSPHPFSAGLRAYPTSCGKVERSGRVWIPTAVCDRLGTNLFSISKGGVRKKIKQQRSSPKRRSYSCHLKHASSNQHTFIERLWYALALF